MRRRPFGILSFLPLAVCLLLCWVSIRGGFLGPGEGFARDTVDPGRREHLHYGVRTEARGVDVSVRRFVFANDADYRREVAGRGIQNHTWGGQDLKVDFDRNVHPRLERVGFAFGQRQMAGRSVSYSFWSVRVPWWTIAALMLVPHGFVVARGLRAQRSLDWNRAGRCADCGYDLRASAERCPECGSDRLETARPAARSDPPQGMKAAT